MRRLLPIAFAAAALAISCKPTVGVNPDSGDTVPCSSDLDCTTAIGAGNCDSSGFCVLCTGASDCPSNETCSANGTCTVGSGNGGSTGSGNSGGSSNGGSTGGLPPGQCLTNCDCKPDGGSAIKGPACVSGECAAAPAMCSRTNDCACGDICSGTSCVAQCTSNASCPPAKPICYPAGCSICSSSTQCPSGQTCLSSGACGDSPDGGCNASHCCSNGDCSGLAPACNTTTGVCSKCTTSAQCSSGYTCNTTTGACTAPDGGSPGCGPNGCSAGLSCVNNACVVENCQPACSPPQTCAAGNNCTCPTNCGGICATGTTCDMSTCQCGTGSGGSIGGNIGGTIGGSSGFPSGGGSGGILPASCSDATCSGCPSGQSCYCIDPFSSSGLDPCTSSGVACAIENGIGVPGICM